MLLHKIGRKRKSWRKTRLKLFLKSQDNLFMWSTVFWWKWLHLIGEFQDVLISELSNIWKDLKFYFTYLLDIIVAKYVKENHICDILIGFQIHLLIVLKLRRLKAVATSFVCVKTSSSYQLCRESKIRMFVRVIGWQKNDLRFKISMDNNIIL